MSEGEGQLWKLVNKRIFGEHNEEIWGLRQRLSVFGQLAEKEGQEKRPTNSFDRVVTQWQENDEYGSSVKGDFANSCMTRKLLEEIWVLAEQLAYFSR